jgi:hypothetical protein
MTTVPETREDRAADLFERRAEWLPVQAHDGRTGLALPSQRKPGLFHLTDGFSCSCGAFKFGRGRACKHMLATQRLLREVQS